MPPATSSHTFALSSSLVVLKTPHFFYFPEPRALQSKRLSKLTPSDGLDIRGLGRAYFSIDLSICGQVD